MEVLPNNNKKELLNHFSILRREREKKIGILPYGLLVRLSKHCKSTKIDVDLLSLKGCKVKYCLHAEEHFSVSQFFNDKLHVTTKCNDLCSKCGTPLNGRENLKSRHSL